MKAMNAWMVWLAGLSLATAASPAGGRRVAEWKWGDAPAAELPGRVVEDRKQGKVLRIEHREAEPKTFTLLTWKAPGLKTVFYFVRGQVRHEGVEGTGYLEMWNDFGAGNRFFTRTMGQQGPMKAVSGTSPWRPFGLPFNGAGAPGKPESLEINLVLAGKGTVEISSLELFEFADAGAMWAAMGIHGAAAPSGSAPWFVPVSAGVALGAGGTAAACWWMRQRQARELRRMRARDAG
jgi:hypothetical protein